MSKALPADRSWSSLPDLDLIASQTRLILRHSRKFTAAGFLQSLLSSVAIGRARLSYEKLYDLLAVRMIKSGCLAEFAAFAPDPRHLV